MQLSGSRTLIAIVEIETQGTLLRRRSQRYHIQGKSVNHARGAVTGFSRKSRQRLIEKMARLDVQNVRTCFLTLTFHGTPAMAEATRAFKQFTMRLRRLFPRMSAMWRKEFQERGAAHYHLICFNMPYWKQAAIQRCWEECTRETRSIVHIKLLRNKRQAMYYVAKYIAKLPHNSETTSLVNTPYQHEQVSPSTGRAWGYLGKVLLPMARLRRAYIIDDDVSDYLSWSMRAMGRGKSNKYSDTLTLYSDDVLSIFETALHLGGFEREKDDFLEFCGVLSSGRAGDFLADRYDSARPFIDWKQAINRAYQRLEEEFLTKQRLSRSFAKGWK